jgi:16S rRNA (guanine527-N7)-methyltransferase
VTDLIDYLKIEAGAVLQRALSERELSELCKYLDILGKWQKSQRLVGSSDPRWITDNIIVDSLFFARALPVGVRTICDVGSGAGVPGVPLKIVRPELEMDLLESRQRRASFLAAVIREIPLPRCRVLNLRLEEAPAELSSHFDAVVMRCAGKLNGLLRSVRGIVAPGGLIVVSAAPVPSGGTNSRSTDEGEYLTVSAGPTRTRTFLVYQNPCRRRGLKTTVPRATSLSLCFTCNTISRTPVSRAACQPHMFDVKHRGTVGANSRCR